MSSSTPSAATAFAPAPTPPPPIFIGGSNGSGSLPSPHEATFQPPLSLPTDPIGSTAEAALVSKGYQLFPSMRQFQQQQQQGASPMLNNGLPGSSIPPFNMPPPPPLATRGFPGNGVAPPSTQSVINGGGGAGIGKGKAPGTGEFGGDDISEDSRNNATSEDSIQTTKANLSRHDGYRRLVNELDDFLHVVSPQGSILYCSPSAKRHLGISAEDLEGQQLADFIHPDDRQLLIGHINISVVDHAEYSAFCRFRRTSGTHPLLRAEITETAPSAHPYDLDVGGNLATHISEEDFLGQMVGPAEPMGAMARDDDAGHPPSVFGSVVGGGAGGGPLGAAAAANRRRSLDGTPDRKMGGIRESRMMMRVVQGKRQGRESTSSPEWRKGPLGPKTLCNACGLAYSKKLQKEKKRMQKLADAEGGGNGDKDGGSGKNIAGDESTNDD
ncbi:hypothetical protein BC829DRAFT_441954 [Chytridium lagenaria]|nr:hypothetical protein BC829DRAFT_441954 [Chytridium lagenaria]